MRSDGTRSERSQDDSGDFRIESGPPEGRAGRGVGQQLPAAFAPLAEVRRSAPRVTNCSTSCEQT